MDPVDLPRDLPDYFAYAELPALRDTRRFTLTFPYLDGERLDRLQWWWQVGATQARLGGEELLARLRAEAVQRFRAHILRWLDNNQRCLHGGDPFPRLGTLAIESVPAGTADAGDDAEVAEVDGVEIVPPAVRPEPLRLAAG